MKLSFDSLEITDFKCFTKTQVLEFAQFDSGLIFICGRNDVEPRLGANGSGKSSVWGALCWCLYGKTPEGLRNPDLKSWQGNKTPKVALKLKIDNKPHVITRMATTNGLSIDGQEVGSDEAEKLIGVSFDTFINTILLAQGQPLFFDRAPREKMQLFSDVLQLERWEERSTKASAKVRELETLAAEMTGELTGLEATLAQAVELMKKAKEQSAEWETNRRQRVQQFEQTLKQQETILAQQKAVLGRAELAYDGAATELKALRKDLPKQAEEVKVALKHHNDKKYESNNLTTTIIRLERELKALGEADNCPTCGQPIKGTGLAKHKKELLQEIDSLELEVEETILELEELSSIYNRTEAAYTRNSKAAEDFEEKTDSAQTELNHLKPNVARLTVEILALKSNHSEQQEEVNPYTEQVQTLRRKQQQLEVQCQGLKEDLIKAGRQIERTKFWVQGFKDIQLYVISEVLEELELVTNIMLSEVGLEGWKVQYSLEKETKSGALQRGLNVTILSPHNKAAVKYENWSGGEGQRLRIVGALALAQVLLNRACIETNLEVLDEPTRHLSTSGANDLCDYLSDRAKQLEKTIFFIDHLTRESSKFTGVITVVKTMQGSRFE